MELSHRNSDWCSRWLSYYSNNYNGIIPFFIKRALGPKIEISLSHCVDRLGFQVIVRRKGIRRPYADCNGTQYVFEKQNHDGELNFLSVDTLYFFPFAINQDQSVGVYIIQMESTEWLQIIPMTLLLLRLQFVLPGKILRRRKSMFLEPIYQTCEHDGIIGMILFLLNKSHSRLKKLEKVLRGVGFYHFDSNAPALPLQLCRNVI